MWGHFILSNALPKAPLAIPHPRRIFLEIGLFSELFKAEVSEYIAARSKARPEDFSKSIVLKPRHFYVYQPI